MERRSFLKGMLATTAMAAVPLTLGSPKDRIVEIDTEDGWQEIDMRYLKKGDVFRVKERSGGWLTSYAVAASDSSKGTEGLWGIEIYKGNS